MNSGQALLLTNSGQMLSLMIVLAASKHANQYDKQGKPYILHCMTVLTLLGSDADEELQCIAVGHDLIEDTDVTYSLLREMGFTERIIEGIASVTKIRGETWEEYKAKVKGNKDGIKVKKADLTHNSSIERQKGTSSIDADRITRYFQFYSELKEVS